MLEGKEEHLVGMEDEGGRGVWGAMGVLLGMKMNGSIEIGQDIPATDRRWMTRKAQGNGVSGSLQSKLPACLGLLGFPSMQP